MRDSKPPLRVDGNDGTARGADWRPPRQTSAGRPIPPRPDVAALCRRLPLSTLLLLPRCFCCARRAANRTCIADHQASDMARREAEEIGPFERGRPPSDCISCPSGRARSSRSVPRVPFTSGCSGEHARAAFSGSFTRPPCH